MSVTFKQIRHYASLILGVAVVGAGIVAYVLSEPTDDDKYANTEKDMCWNIPGWQPSIPAGQVLVQSAKESTVAVATAKDSPKDLQRKITGSGAFECITQATLQANNAEGKQRAIDQAAAEKKAGAALERYIVTKHPMSWQAQLDMVLTFYCTYDDDGAFAPASAYYQKYWQVSASKPLPQDFGRAVDRFCPDKFGNGR